MLGSTDTSVPSSTAGGGSGAGSGAEAQGRSVLGAMFSTPHHRNVVRIVQQTWAPAAVPHPTAAVAGAMAARPLPAVARAPSPQAVAPAQEHAERQHAHEQAWRQWAAGAFGVDERSRFPSLAELKAFLNSLETI